MEGDWTGGLQHGGLFLPAASPLKVLKLTAPNTCIIHIHIYIAACIDFHWEAKVNEGLMLQKNNQVPL